MAGTIYIRGRKEPVIIEDNDRARRIKRLRFGDPTTGEGKADPSELLDLGDEWAGEIGKISGVEIKKEEPKREPPPDPRIEREKELKELLALSFEERAKRRLFFFEMRWWKRSGMKEKIPPEAVKSEALKMAVDWFKKNPNEAYLDISALEPLLVKYWGAETKQPTLAEKMRVVHRETD